MNHVTISGLGWWLCSRDLSLVFSFCAQRERLGWEAPAKEGIVRSLKCPLYLHLGQNISGNTHTHIVQK